MPFSATVPAATVIDRVLTSVPGYKYSSKYPQILLMDKVRVLGSGRYTPTQNFREYPPGVGLG